MDDPAVIHAEESMFVKMNLFENRTITDMHRICRTRS